MYFVAPDGTLMAVAITTTSTSLGAATPVPLFRTQLSTQPFKFGYAVSADGRFLVNNPTADEATASPITVIGNLPR